MKERDQQINEAVNKISDKAAEEAGAGIETAIRNVLEKGMMPKEALGFTEEMVEGIYSHAYRFYNAGRYQEALLLFRLLILIDPSESRFSMGMAACYHMQKEYISATTIYSMVTMVDPNNPLPHYHSSDCYMKQGAQGSAINELDTAIRLCGKQPQYALVKERSQLMLDRLKSGEVIQNEEEAGAHLKEE